MKKVFAVFIGLVMAVGLKGENYPYKSDYLWVTVHDPVMAKEGDTYYLYSTGMGIQQMTSRDRTTEKLGTVPVIHFYK